ncbi:hypothetical protein SPHINGO391_490211 [Sphingomonas aurantiaca]|uniref:Uncharacterized protein n=1 Tax=Sphingomonas aurantiaca TaxID=185949 RepID=A0A5E8A6F5_9SPHN|nr:hypothetical protein SPHINGO391_490211 [Sphingomonas aurantiaca]
MDKTGDQHAEAGDDVKSSKIQRHGDLLVGSLGGVLGRLC